MDYSKHPIENLFLAKQLRRLNPTKKIEIIGLVEREHDVNQLVKMILMGVKLFSIKDDEFHDCVYDAVSMKFPKKAHIPQFAYTDVQDYWEIQKYLRINSVGTTSIQVETDACLLYTSPSPRD